MCSRTSRVVFLVSWQNISIKILHLAQEIEKTVVEKAQNMYDPSYFALPKFDFFVRFLLAQLQLDALQENSSPKAVRKALVRLPNDLDRIYYESLL